ncbi:MAG TPA: type II toxin-antitoxin system HipA family toxin [Acidimicrobiales bacterium]|nr:type II toxin-antitoxin system HipA family toxin [Acidimicrobiales bacterium]
MTYRQVDLIEVQVWGSTVGAVALDPATNFYAFEYDPAWVRRGIELAPFHMPARSGVFEFPDLAENTYRRLPAMLADSLPDRFGNALVTARLAEEGVLAAQITSLDRLAYSADRGMGALEFRPPADDLAHHATAIQLADLVVAARSALRGEFAGDDATLEALTLLIQVGTSAGGARPKAVVCFNPTTGQVRSGQLSAPEGYEHWLLKLDGLDEDHFDAARGFGRIEYAYSLMATAAGVEMEPCRLLEENDRAHFMTRRFDRLPDQSKVHVQTLCALDHLDFNLPDTHSYAQYLSAIDRLGLGPDALAEGFRRVVFNVAAVNRDDHTKNLSFCCHADGQWSLAPAYDINHAYNPQGQWTQRHQMSVNGKFEGISRSDLAVMADRFAVPGPSSVISEVMAAVEQWPEFAEKAGVSGPDIQRIRADQRAFLPA